MAGDVRPRAIDQIRDLMGRWTNIAAAVALSFAAASASAQTADAAQTELEPITAGQVQQNADEESRTAPQGMTQDEAIAATPDQPVAVPSVGGGLANAGTMSEAALGQPLGGHNIQPQVTELGKRANNFNIALLLIMGIVTVFVFSLLLWSILKYRRKDGVLPSKTTHNVLIEVIWTVVPVLILVGIAIPSFQLLAAQYDPPEADVTVKAIGHQWYWEYEYPDEGGFSFDAIMLPADQAAERGEPRLLATDNRVVVPVGANVKVLVTSVDVIHSWAMPAFWVKMDAVPGRINETWFRAERPGVYYGQCSELCGTQHAFMPIVVEVVEQDVYDAWVSRRQEDAGIDPAELAETVTPEAVEPTADESGVPTAEAVEADSDEGADVGDETAAPTGTVIEQSAGETSSPAQNPTE